MCQVIYVPSDLCGNMCQVIYMPRDLCANHIRLMTVGQTDKRVLM
jgi:hypothetical protein